MQSVERLDPERVPRPPSRVGVASGQYLWAEPLRRHWAALDTEGRQLPGNRLPKQPPKAS